MKKIFQKTIALTSGVLVLSAAMGYIVFAWDGPTAEQPQENTPTPINIGPVAQTKQGALAVSSLFASGNKVFLNDDGEEGDIERVDYIKGQDGLYLDSDPFNIASVHLDNQNKEIKFSIKGEERMKVDKNGKMHILKLSDCFLEVDEDGKIRCYVGGQIPDGDEFWPSQTEILHIGINASDSWTVPNEEQEVVIKVAANISAYGSSVATNFKFYIKRAGEEEYVEEERIAVSGGFRYDWPWHDYWWNYKSGTWYYHIKQGDEVKIVTCTSCSCCANASATVYKLRHKRDVIDYASCEGTILYYYDVNSTGKMNEVENQYNPDVPVSVAITSDELPISFPNP
jgi:hypothetical protein